MTKTKEGVDYMNTLNLDSETTEMLLKIMEINNCNEVEAIKLSLEHTISTDESLK